MRQWLVGVIAAGLVAGCGTSGNNPTNLVPVSGKVVAANGKTVPWVEVNFYPTERGSTSAVGQAGADGVFTVKSMGNQDGMVPGRYKVTVAAWKTRGAVPPALDRKWAEEITTDLTANVSSATSDLVITLK